MALGSPKEAVEQVHSYGGRIFADVVNLQFARKAAASGVDGLALVCAGAGGHTGQLSPFAFVDEVRTFADSLGAPFAAPYSFELCRRNVDRIVRIDDEAMARAMGFLFQRMKMAVEPACAATTCALLGPLREQLAGRRVVLVFCGSNIDWETWQSQAVLG